MRTSWTLFSVFGIPIQAHLSVGLLAAYILLTFRGDLALGLFMVVALLVSILLHELAHSVVARAFGGSVGYIALQLLGGCAAITRMPPKAWQECLMALAGPVCSFVLAGLCWVSAVVFSQTYLVARDMWGQPIVAQLPNQWLAVVAVLNFGLACFNLVPAFPMDGGRVLRSGLQSVGLSKVRATEWAVRVGQGFAALWAAVSVLAFMGIRLHAPAGLPDAAVYLWDIVFGSGGLLLLCIAYMIWVAGRQELMMVRAEDYYGGWR